MKFWIEEDGRKERRKRKKKREERRKMKKKKQKKREKEDLECGVGVIYAQMKSALVEKE